MQTKILAMGAIALTLLFPAVAAAKKHKEPPRGMIESMEALPCGVKEKGLNGLGAVWGSIGVTSVSSDQKLCPQYLLRTDQLEYHIRPQDKKHPVVLPIGQEAEFKIKKDRMLLKVVNGDNKTRTYQVVAMEPVKSANTEYGTAYGHSSASTAQNRPTSPTPPSVPSDQLPLRAVGQNPPIEDPPPPR